jgi:hypothetical protein
MTDAEKIAHAWRNTLDWHEPNARLVLADLANACNVAQSSHAPGDSHATAFAEGKRAVFLFIAGRIGLPLIPET